MKIGIIGLGTVGEGVLKVLTKEKNSIFEKSQADIEVKYACDLNINREFSFEFDKSILVDNYKKILEACCRTYWWGNACEGYYYRSI